MNILLHMCCSNCSLFPVKSVQSVGHSFTGFWYNPNIHPLKEYRLRLDSLKGLSDEWKFDVLYTDDYSPEEFFNVMNSVASPLPPLTDGEMEEIPADAIPPFPDRCSSCYKLRLEKTARQAREQGFDAFSTTLLISPYQDFDGIVATGNALAEQYNVLFHGKDYRPHFREAMERSKELGLYRQKYCGCIFSREERKRKRKKS